MKLPYAMSSDEMDRRRSQQFDQLYAEVSKDAQWLLDEYVVIFIKNVTRFGPIAAKSLVMSILKWKFEHEQDRQTAIRREFTKVWRHK